MKRYLLILALLGITLGAAAQSKVIVAGDNVCLRSRPNEQSKLTGAHNPHFNTGEMLNCVGTVNGYYKVVYRGSYYYLPTRYARPRGYSNNGGRNGYSSYSSVVVAGDNVCLRSNPNENSKLTGPYNPHLNTGDRLGYVGEVGNYYKVNYRGNYYYLPKRYGRLRR